MRLSKNGIDIFYIDESHDRNVYVVTCVAIPFLRPQSESWHIVWPDYLEKAKSWRKHIKDDLHIPTSKELHAVNLAAGRGQYYKGKYNFPKPKASGVYRKILNELTWLPEACLMSSAVTRGHSLYGNVRLEAAAYALFQRMRTRCARTHVNAITFFDQGHPEYRRLYRRAQVHLPTGSIFGRSQSRNLPLSMFTKDANEKDSKHCYFTQVADLVAYAAFLKVKSEQGQLKDWQKQYRWDNVYDEIPRSALNSKATGKAPKDAIVRMP